MFFHGTSSVNNISYKLLSPENTNVLSERGRKKNLDKIFFTDSLKYAKIYAGRACQRFGGSPVIFKVVVLDYEVLQIRDGCSIYMADYAFVERYNFK